MDSDCSLADVVTVSVFSQATLAKRLGLPVLPERTTCTGMHRSGFLPQQMSDN